MEENNKYTLTIKYLNGNEEKFEFLPQIDQVNMVSRLTKILDSNQIILELEDKIVLIPIPTVQTIEISPLPPKLPDTVIRNVRLLS